MDYKLRRSTNHDLDCCFINLFNLKNNMTLVISGTNRPGSRTQIISKYILSKLESAESQLVDLEVLSPLMRYDDMYNGDIMNSELAKFQDEIFDPATKLIIVSPEYNGSFPGILKTFIDVLSTRNGKFTFKNKKVALVGVAAGRAGNLRGMEHLTGLLNYLGVHVFPNKLPISSINGIIVDNEVDQSKLGALDQLIIDFQSF